MNDFATALIERYKICPLKNISATVHNRKLCVMYFIYSDEIPKLFIKLVKNTDGNNTIKNEYNNLIKLDKITHNEKKLKESIPCAHSLNYYEGKAFIVTTFMSGVKVSFNDFRYQQYKKITDWLVNLHKLTTDEIYFKKDIVLQYINNCSNNWKLNFDLPYKFKNYVNEIIEDYYRINESKLTTCFSHNDFTSANILFNKKKISVIDWGNAMGNGFPLIDAFELILYLVNKKNNNYPKSLRLLIKGDVYEKKMFKLVLEKYIKEFSLSNEMIYWLLRLLFIGKAHRFYIANRPERVSQLIDCFHLLKNNKFL